MAGKKCYAREFLIVEKKNLETTAGPQMRAWVQEKVDQRITRGELEKALKIISGKATCSPEYLRCEGHAIEQYIRVLEKVLCLHVIVVA